MVEYGGNTYVQLNNITVNIITNTAGVFVGPNNQWGWSSHYKETDIITVRGNNNRARFNHNTIYDNDISDTHIDDKDIMFNQTSYNGETILDLNSININNVNDNSGTFAGENNQFGWGAHSKTSSVNAIRGINNYSSSYYNVIDDRDLIDAFINDPDINNNYR